MIGSRRNKIEIPDYSFHKSICSIRSIIQPSLYGAVEINEIVVERKKEITWMEIMGDFEISGTPHPFLIKNIELNRISFDTRFSSNHGQVLNLDKPSKTIICSYTFQPRLYVGIKYNNKYYLRNLLVEELQRIQGFPKDFIFEGSDSQKIKQIGNAVPPSMISEIIKLMF